MYSSDIKPNFDKILENIARKNRTLYKRIFRKMRQIVRNPQHYKNLRKPLQYLKAVHIGSFVLCFSVDENTKIVCFEKYEHHDKIYL